MDIKQDVVTQFGKSAEKYVSSSIHAKGNDLKMMIDISNASKDSILLDVATGGGHTANGFAPLVKKVIAVDLTEKMLMTAKNFIEGNGHKNVEFVQGDAEALPFEDNIFDFVTCRIAVHHFPNLREFIKEVQRVLKPNGHFLLIDNVAPETEEYDKFYNSIEKLRDHSHFRAWKKSEWLKFLEEENFIIEAMLRHEKTFDYIDWCERMNMADNDRSLLDEIILEASDEIKRHFNIHEENQQIKEFTGESVLIKAKKV